MNELAFVNFNGENAIKINCPIFLIIVLSEDYPVPFQ